MIFKVLSNPNHSMILRYSERLLHACTEQSSDKYICYITFADK